MSHNGIREGTFNIQKENCCYITSSQCGLDSMHHEVHGIRCAPAWPTAKVIVRQQCVPITHVDEVFCHHGGEKLHHHVHEHDQPVGLRDVVSGISGLPQHNSVPDSPAVAVHVEHKCGLVDTQQVLSYLLNGLF